jgi:dihydroflavonol-4-reductase
VEVAGRTCLVTGATGFLGSWVVERLLTQGARVRCLMRSTSKLEFLDAKEIELARGDVTDFTSVRAASGGADFVFHLAGRIKAPRESDYYQVNYLGTINVLEACLQAAPGVERVVVVSSQSAAGPSEPGQPLNESTSCRPISPYGRSKRQAELAAESYHARLPVTIVRPPSVYGPRDRETLQVIRLISLGLRPILSKRGAISLVHASDLADGILLAATQAAAIGKTYFLAGDESPSPSELVQLIARATERGGISIPVPPNLLRLAGRAAELVRDLTGFPMTFDRWKAEEIIHGYWACTSARAKADFGYSPRVPLATGLRDTVEWYRQAGWL